MKSRLRQFALPLPEVTFVGQQAITQERPQGILDEFELVEFFRSVNQNFVHQFGVANHIEAKPPELCVMKIAKLRLHIFDELQHVELDTRKHSLYRFKRSCAQPR